jgi:hypothetical protein
MRDHLLGRQSQGVAIGLSHVAAQGPTSRGGRTEVPPKVLSHMTNKTRLSRRWTSGAATGVNHVAAREHASQEGRLGNRHGSEPHGSVAAHLSGGRARVLPHA